MNPLLKWPGGKRRLLTTILEHFPERHGRYFEPLCGGAALFFSLEEHHATLNDVNPDLIECYQAVAQNPENVIDILSNLANTEEAYYRVRSWNVKNSAEKSAKMIYLCRLSFNGIYRVNLRGEYNVPYGRKTHISSCDADLIRSASRLLNTANLMHGSFRQALETVEAGDLVYFDPPYTVAHSHNGFIKYNQTLFSWRDQQRLASLAEELRQNGCFVLVSNAEHQTIRDLYPSFDTVEITRHSVIAASGTARKQVTELLFVGRPTEL